VDGGRSVDISLINQFINTLYPGLVCPHPLLFKEAPHPHTPTVNAWNRLDTVHGAGLPEANHQLVYALRSCCRVAGVWGRLLPAPPSACFPFPSLPLTGDESLAPFGPRVSPAGSGCWGHQTAGLGRVTNQTRCDDRPLEVGRLCERHTCTSVAVQRACANCGCSVCPTGKGQCDVVVATSLFDQKVDKRTGKRGICVRCTCRNHHLTCILQAEDIGAHSLPSLLPATRLLCRWQPTLLCLPKQPLIQVARFLGTLYWMSTCPLGLVGLF
jgi:hypothetical protein